MNHHTVEPFWELFNKLPIEIQSIAKKNFDILKSNPQHPSLHFKKVNEFWSIRIGLRYRALGVQKNEDVIWFWIGNHSDYDKLIS
jgi:hypothetical protein